jgi:hypothetical protein
MSSNGLPNPAEWMQIRRDAVMDRFYSLPGAFSDGIGDERFVYIAGKRKDRALLVAHADTVYPDIDGIIDIGYQDGVLYSKARNKEISYINRFGNKVSRTGIGIGADDRAGCAILWELRKLGHSLLITSGEEVGCVATNRLMNTPYWANEFNTTHSFAVEFDRRGSKDLVFYRVGTKEFAEYVKKETGYIPDSGSVTDISHLCRLICGVNLSVGYYREHSPEEKLVVDQWQNTLATAYHWLSKKDLPCFELDRSRLFEVWEESWNRWATSHSVTTPKKNLNKKKEQKGCMLGQRTPLPVAVVQNEQGVQCLKCPFCRTFMTDEEWYEAGMSCIKCKKSF